MLNRGEEEVVVGVGVEERRAEVVELRRVGRREGQRGAEEGPGANADGDDGGRHGRLGVRSLFSRQGGK